MKPVWRYSLFAVAAYLLFILVLLPADRVYSLLQQRGIRVPTLYQVSGSIWHGHIDRARIAGLDVNNIEWCLHPWALLIGRLEAGVSLANSTAPLAVVAGRNLDGSYYIHSGDEALSIPVLESLITARPSGITGAVSLDLQDIRVQAGKLQAITGSLQWQQAGLGAPLDIEIGNFELSVNTKDGVIHGTLKDTGGPLQAQGQIVLQADNRYRLTMTLVSRDRSRNDLKQALRLLGTPSPDGRVSLTLSGRLDSLATNLRR